MEVVKASLRLPSTHQECPHGRHNHAHATTRLSIPVVGNCPRLSDPGSPQPERTRPDGCPANRGAGETRLAVAGPLCRGGRAGEHVARPERRPNEYLSGLHPHRLVGGPARGALFPPAVVCHHAAPHPPLYHYGALPGLRGVFRGLNPVVIGIFAVAVYRLSTAAITEVTHGVLALAGALALWVTPLGIVSILLLAGALGVALYGSRPWGLVATTVVAALQGVLAWSPPWLHLAALSGWASSPGASLHPPGVGQIGLFFAKVGLFTFGGGLVLLAFL